MNKETLEQRMAELTKQRDQILGNLNLICGQLIELRHILGQLENPEPTVEQKEPLRLDSVK